MHMWLQKVRIVKFMNFGIARSFMNLLRVQTSYELHDCISNVAASLIMSWIMTFLIKCIGSFLYVPTWTPLILDVFILGFGNDCQLPWTVWYHDY